MRSPLKENVQVKRVRTNQTDDLLLVPIRRVTPVKLVPIQPAPQMVDTSSSSVITSKARRSLGGDFSKKVHICHLVKNVRYCFSLFLDMGPKKINFLSPVFAFCLMSFSVLNQIKFQMKSRSNVSIKVYKNVLSIILKNLEYVMFM